MKHTGKRHGRGEYHYGDGSKYIGNWDNDKINGEGTSWYPNGNKYVSKKKFSYYRIIIEFTYALCG